MLTTLLLRLPHIAAAVAALLCARKLLHYFQLESYQFYGYFKTVLRQWKIAVLPPFVLGILFWLLAFAGKSLYNAAEPQTVWKLLCIEGLVSAAILALGVSVSALAVIVALSEFMCSGQIYLATLLSSIETGMTLRNFGYLLVYCFAFLLPSLIISILVVFGKSRTAISDWLLNRMFLIKVLNCMIFLALVIAAWMI